MQTREIQTQFSQILEDASKQIVDYSYLHMNEAIPKVYERAQEVLKQAKAQGVSLDLTTKANTNSSSDVNILCLALAVNDLPYIEELLKNEFHPDKYHYQAKNLFPKIVSYEAVQLLLKYGVLQKIKKENQQLFDSLKQRSAFITFADVRELSPPAAETEYKELPLAKSRGWKDERIVYLSADGNHRFDIIDLTCYGIYNFGAYSINKDKTLLANYNLLPHTYSSCADKHAHHKKTYNQPDTDQLRTLYVLSIGLNMLPPSHILQLRQIARQKLGATTNDWVPIRYPTGATLCTFEAIDEFLGLYIYHNPKLFKELDPKACKELPYSLRMTPWRGIGVFTGHIPGFGFINHENVFAIYEAIFAKEPKLDLFKLLRDEKAKESQQKLVAPVKTGMFAAAAEKPRELTDDEKDSLTVTFWM